MRLIDADALISDLEKYGNKQIYADVILEIIKQTPTVSSPTGNWISEVDTGIWFLKCSECGCRVQEEKYRIAVGTAATKCPYCGAELGLGGYTYDDYADRPSQRGEE